MKPRLRLAMPKRLLLIVFVASVSRLAPGVVFARKMKQGENCIIPAGEVIEGALHALPEPGHLGTGRRQCDRHRTADNHLGRSRQERYLAGLELELTGTIRRDLHDVGLKMNLAAPTEARHRPLRGQILFASLSAQVGQTVTVPGPISALGYQLLLGGQVDGEISYWGSAFVLNSIVFGEVYASVGNPASAATDLETLLLPLDIKLSVVTPGIAVASTARIHGQLRIFWSRRGGNRWRSRWKRHLPFDRHRL